MRWRGGSGLVGDVRNDKLLSRVLAAGATAVTIALAGAPAAGALRLPRPPKVTNYQATLDLAGYIDVKVEQDSTGDCVPGQDVTIDFESSFELGAPRRTGITVINGAVAGGLVRNKGTASHKGTLSGYRETNYCPPSKRAELTKPSCTSHRGRLQAILGSNAEDFKRSDDLTPLVYPVNIMLSRWGGGTQDDSCRRYLSSGIRPAIRRETTELNALDTDPSALTIPIGANDKDFVRLKKGQTLRRVVTLNGACNHVLVGREAPADASASRERSKCTVRGKIYIAVKRIS